MGRRGHDRMVVRFTAAMGVATVMMIWMHENELGVWGHVTSRWTRALV